MALDKIATILLTKNYRLKELLTSYLSEHPEIKAPQAVQDYSEAYNIASSLKTASILILDLEIPTEAYFQFIKKLNEDCLNCKIVVVSETTEVDFIVKSIRCGVKNILASPIIKSEFCDVIKELKSELTNSENKNKSNCKVISVFSNKGGVGKTSIACNLAYNLALVTKEKVALVDINFVAGDITTFLDIQPAFDMSYLFDNYSLMNRDFLLGTMEKFKNTNLYVIGEQPNFKNLNGVSAKQLGKFIEVLRETFSYVVIDTESNFEERTITTLDVSDMILVPVVMNLPALRNCQRCLNLFDKLGYQEEKVKIVVNRYLENDEISQKDAETLLGKVISWKVPNNYAAQIAAINKGSLVSEINPECNVSKSYKELSIDIADFIFRNSLIKKYSNNITSGYNIRI